jgi:hypothetical protein
MSILFDYDRNVLEGIMADQQKQLKDKETPVVVG